MFWIRSWRTGGHFKLLAHGPMPIIMERMWGRSRMYLMLLSPSRASLHRQIDRWLLNLRDLPSSRKTRWAIDIDPQEL